MALVLSPEPPLASWLLGLDAQIARSASFFAGRPVILDCGLLDPSDEGIAELLPALADRGVRLIAIEGADQSWPATEGWDWPEGFSGGRAVGALEVPDDVEGGQADAAGGAAGLQEAARAAPSLLIEEPVRSGQSIVYAEGDVIVIGSVASGAEIAAGGSIHIYGTLRGRAVAGLSGNRDARILCRRMNAELIAIDGYYMTAEDMPAGLLGKSTQTRLDGETLVLLPLD
ncbi:septum formation inhibitor MinC [Lichenicoccus roseus]|uniref:Probable septum site-determining protein MinC n=2 Tax=Lichenicoccus roseus TaxID=2683649 RepID=A0A5R9J8F3_9PROT|nr:septum site-determining protein MinC [Lichenicoccus roseus]TLU72817.1 septum formation inhibitor MinC [Lichenicoccus roseus]